MNPMGMAMTEKKATTDKQTAPLGDLITQAQGLLTVNRMMAPQLEQFWKAQEKILEEAGVFSQGWFDRRHEATEAALDTISQLGGQGGMADASGAQAIAEWHRGSFDRMTEDFRQWITFCTRSFSHFAKAEMQAGKQELEEAERLASATGGAKHAIPV
jgi:hypothetical protein